MKPRRFMFIAGEASGDTLASELILAVKQLSGVEGTEFFGAGGPRMQRAGMEVLVDFTQRAVFGAEALKGLLEYRRRFEELLRNAIARQPDAIVCVDFAGFNRRFAHAVKEHVRSSGGEWQPRIVQYVSPQVWASRPKRAESMARDIDLLLTIFPFEKSWYAQRTPGLRVEFVGHPMVDRYTTPESERRFQPDTPRVLFLPGSRPSELKRHLPVMSEVWRAIRAKHPRACATAVLPERLLETARGFGLPTEFEARANLADELASADLAIAKSGTVTLECAFFRVPTVVMYKTSALTYAVARRIVQVKWVAMPNILADEEVFPEFVQGRATVENIARAALELLSDTARRNTVRAKLDAVINSLGEPGAAGRAARHILELLPSQPRGT